MPVVGEKINFKVVSENTRENVNDTVVGIVLIVVSLIVLAGVIAFFSFSGKKPGKTKSKTVKTKTEKVEKVEKVEEVKETEDELPIINGLDWGYAEKHFNSREDMLQTLAFFRTSLEADAAELQILYERIEEPDGFKNYCTKIHSMKNSAATVGIIPLAGTAKVMEDAARSNQKAPIDAMMPIFTEKWLSYKEMLKDFGGSDADGAEEVDTVKWQALVDQIRKAAEDMDISALDDLAAELSGYKVLQELEEKTQSIQAAIVRFDVEYLMKI